MTSDDRWAPRYYRMLPDGAVSRCSPEDWRRDKGGAGAHWIIAKDRDESAGPDGVEVSTVFLGLDHDLSGNGPPILWETMVFGGPLDGHTDRYTSLAAALAGHQEICRMVAGEP
jgi:hypothetical protein